MRKQNQKDVYKLHLSLQGQEVSQIYQHPQIQPPLFEKQSQGEHPQKEMLDYPKVHKRVSPLKENAEDQRAS
jgi:hypothetical protein